MSNQKGQNFEREESRFLSLWWTDGEIDDIFWRQRVKITSKTPHAERQLGDITAVHTIGLPFVEMFNVELKAGYSRQTTKQAKKNNDKRNEKRIKNGKEPKSLSVRNIPWDLLDVIDSNKIDDSLEIIQFWNQCESDAELSGRIPLLIFKRDFHLPVVVINGNSFGWSEIINYKNNLKSRKINLFLSKNKELTFYRHEDFFEWLDPETIRFIHSQKINGRKL